MRRLAVVFFSLLLMTKVSAGQQQPNVTRTSIPTKPIEAPDYEKWHIELTAAYWPLTPAGDVRTHSLSGNLKNDLGIDGWKSHPAASAVIQFRRRNKIVIEAIKYRLNGGAVLHRNLVFSGKTFLVADQTQSTARLSSMYAGYERDLMSSPYGFAGFSAGIQYMEANIKIRDLTQGVEQVNDTRLAFPVAGGAFRVFPKHRDFFNLNGEIRGMALGNYGHNLDSSVNLGLRLSRTVTLQLGLRVLETDLHNKFETEGMNATFRGPTISIQWRDRGEK